MKCRYLLACLVMAGFADSMSAQTPARNGAGRGARNSPAASMSRAFDQSSPAVGDLVPDVAGYDSNGRALKLRSLTGRPAVIVFGCLT